MIKLMTPAQARMELVRITSDPNSAYWDRAAPKALRNLVIRYVNDLYRVSNEEISEIYQPAEVLPKTKGNKKMEKEIEPQELPPVVEEISETQQQQPDYDLEDIFIPEQMQGVSFNKEKFIEIMKRNKVDPALANKLWNEYGNETISVYQQVIDSQAKAAEERALEDQRNAQDKVISDMLQKSGEANPYMSADEMSMLCERMREDLDGPYMNQSGRWTKDQHERAVHQYNYYLSKKDTGGRLGDWLPEWNADRQARMAEVTGDSHFGRGPGSRKASSGERSLENPPKDFSAGQFENKHSSSYSEGENNAI